MRKGLENRLSRLERSKPTDTFKTIYVRGNTPEEHAAEIGRLKQAGLANDSDWFIHEPRGTGEISSKILELPEATFHQMMREIRQKKCGKQIPKEAGRY